MSLKVLWHVRPYRTLFTPEGAAFQVDSLLQYSPREFDGSIGNNQKSFSDQAVYTMNNLPDSVRCERCMQSHSHESCRAATASAEDEKASDSDVPSRTPRLTARSFAKFHLRI